MNAIRYGSNWDVVLRKIRPNHLPHSSGDAAMQMTNGISPAAHAKGENRHVEGIAETAQLHKLLFGDSKIIPKTDEMLLHHVKRECIMSCRNGSMRREETSGTNLLGGFF